MVNMSVNTDYSGVNYLYLGYYEDALEAIYNGFRARVKAYYEDDYTYRETAKHFGISTNTVGRFLKV